jgi:hypothetical protein
MIPTIMVLMMELCGFSSTVLVRQRPTALDGGHALCVPNAMEFPLKEA